MYLFISLHQIVILTIQNFLRLFMNVILVYNVHVKIGTQNFRDLAKLPDHQVHIVNIFV